MPLYEYDHLLGWANVQRHVAEEITLLCDMHHREKTSGLLPLELVNAANRDPFNLRQGVSKPHDLHYSGDECEIVLGSSSFTTKDQGERTLSIPLVIDGVPIIGFVLSDGHLLLNLQLFDEQNNLIALIQNNRLAYSTSPWDIRLAGRNLVIRAGQRRILIDLVFEVPNKVVIRRGRLLLNGVEVVIQPDYTLVVNNGNLLGSATVKGTPFGLVLGNQDVPAPTALRFTHIPRYSHNTIAAMRNARKRMTEMKAMKRTSPPPSSGDVG